MNARIEQTRQELTRQLAPAIEWYRSREVREQRIMQVLGVLILVALLFWLVWLPSWQARDEARHRYVVNQQTLAWIESNAPAVRAARGGGGQGGGETLGANWIGEISRSAQSYGLVLRGFTPNGDESVRIQMESQPANPMLLWLHHLEEMGVQLTTLEMSEGDVSGTADLHATLSR